MDRPGDRYSEDEPKVMNECVFDVNISDSQFELKDEVVGACDPNEAEEDGETEDVDNSSNPQRSDSKNLSETAPSIGSGSSGKGQYSPGPAAPGSESGTGPGTASNDNVEDRVYHGLPPPGSQKHYRTDYPRELRIKKVCSPKPPGKRKTVDNYRTQPLAAFSLSALQNLQNQGSNKSGTTGSQKQQASSEKVVTAYSKHCQPRARELPPIVSVSDEDVIDYLEDYNIQMMFEYFLGMCVLNTPEDPFKYIADMAEQLIQARSDEGAFEKLPRLLPPAHVESMFRLYDRVGSGHMGYNQYRNAFDAMGLVRFNQEPHGYLTNQIPQQIFVKEANKAINDLLRSFMGKTTRSGNDC